jgi:hypothetical protein
MQFDAYLANLNLAFEFQGYFHYHSAASVPSFGSLSNRSHRDQLKLEACKDAGITLIQIPYWWDQSEISLAEYISQQRPELTCKMAKLLS